MESTNANIEESVKRDSTLESLAYIQGSKNIARNQLQMRNRLIQEGTEYVYGQVLGDLIFESYWLDTPVKEASVGQIEESINDLFTFIEENYTGSKVLTSNQSRLLENINNVIDDIVKEAVERILIEAKENNEAFTEFSLSEAEEDKLDDKLCELGKDEIVEIIKSKVAQVVQDEKTKGEEKSKMFDEIEAATQSSDEDLDEVDEATFIGTSDGEVTIEGATIDTLKTVFSFKCKKAKAAYKTAQRLTRLKDYKEAIKEWNEAEKLFKEMLTEVKNIDDDVPSTICSWICGLFSHLLISFVGGAGGFESLLAGGAQTLLVTLVGPLEGGAFNSMASILGFMATNEENFRRDRTKKGETPNYYKAYLIRALNANIDMCNLMATTCTKLDHKSKNISVKEAIGIGLNKSYTSSERHIVSLLESGVDFNLQINTSDGDLKAYVSTLCKKIHEALMCHEYRCALVLMNEFENKLSNVPETISSDVKEFILSMTNMIYGAVPADEIIISRIGTPMGSPGIKSVSPIIDMISISWIDILVNIKTNLGSIKDYCTSKIDDNSGCGSTGELNQPTTPSLQSIITNKQNMLLNNSIGGSIFESLMMMNISSTSRTITESKADIPDNSVEEAALIESLLQYTVLETLDTLGIYKFRLMDINSLKKTCMGAVSEGTTPVYGESDKKAIGVGSDEKTGKKKIRINTRKMRQKN